MDRIYDVNWDVGAHTGFSGKICDTLWTSVNYGMYATQFFMGNPHGFNRAKITEEDISESKKILSKYPLHVFTHFPYISNLAGSIDSLAWNGDDKQDAKTSHVLRSLEYELSVLSNFNSLRNGVVIHPGNFKDRNVGLSTISKSINKIHFSSDSKLILENSAGQGVSLATTFGEIKTIIDGVHESKKGNIGVCVDTCHIFAYGEYDLGKISDVDRMFSDFDSIIGLDRFTLLHLNDSQTVQGSRKDRHELIGKGHIWGKSVESLSYLLEKCKTYGIPAILETHGIDMLTIAKLTRPSITLA